MKLGNPVFAQYNDGKNRSLSEVTGVVSAKVKRESRAQGGDRFRWATHLLETAGAAMVAAAPSNHEFYVAGCPQPLSGRRSLLPAGGVRSRDSASRQLPPH
jgi:hypothetical protein